MMLHAPTIVELFCRRIEADGPRLALGVKCSGAFHWLSWQDVAADVWRLAAALVAEGVQPGDRVSLVSENRHEWILCDLAIQLARAVHVPIHPTLSGLQISWQIKHSGCRVAFLSAEHQAAKLAPLAAELPTEISWFSFEVCQSAIGDKPIRRFADLCERSSSADGERLARAVRREITAASLATILYTSGTTGEPKGVMLSQGNLATNCCSTIEQFGFVPDQVRLNFLPLSHIFARTCDLYCWLVEGSQLAIAESRETVLADCQAVKPTCLNGVPYFYDKVYRGLCEAGKQDIPGVLKRALGGAIERCCAGGAALPDYLYDYYLGQGLPLLQGYGLSESSPVITISTPTQYRRGSCGRTIPDVGVQIADDGEIMTRGPHVMQGYYLNPQATADVLNDGWLATGDIGRLDEDGYLYITGRKKEILVTSGGKNVAPVFLEALLTEDPLILQAMVVGDGRSHLVALIVPNEEALAAEAVRQGLTERSSEAVRTHPDIVAMYRARIEQRLASVSPHEQVRKFTLLPRPFSIEAGELTAKLSLRRQKIAAHYAADIETLYASGDCTRQVTSDKSSH